jgi:hypothetical protein
MQRNELKKILFKELDEFLIPKGFNPVRSRNIYRNKNPEGFQKIYFDLVDKFMQLQIDIQFDIRFDPLEKLKGKVDPFFDDEESVTIFYKYLTLIKDLYDDPYSVVPYSIENETDLAKMIGSFKDMMNLRGFAFLERFQSISDYDDWFNTDLLKGTYDAERRMHWNDPITGLAAAWLNKNPNFERLYELWVEKLIDRSEEKTLKIVRNLKEYIDSLKNG